MSASKIKLDIYELLRHTLLKTVLSSAETEKRTRFLSSPSPLLRRIVASSVAPVVVVIET